MTIWRKWLWDKSGFMLAICTLTGLVLGWFLPDTAHLVFSVALAQVVMAVVVVIREGRIIGAEAKH